MSQPFYSFGIIFKNEIRCLERCLKSLQPIRDAIPCEVVMADTGSDDGSREVAEKYADILIDFPWCDDFAAARNAVMERCSGQWYFSIDADEWFSENIAELIQFSKVRVKHDFGGITIRNYKSLGADQKTNYMDFSGIRLARLSTGVRYQGCIHENLTIPGNKKKTNDVIRLGNTILLHDGYAFANNDDMKAKHDRNVRLLERKLAENPGDLQTLCECIEATRQIDDACEDYSRQAAEVIRKKGLDWKKKGPTVYRDIVSAAQMHKMPELVEWANEALNLFPNSIFTRIDISYYMFSQSWDENNYAGCVKWGEAYRAGMTDYAAGEYDISEPLRGVLEYSSPYWERRLLILLADAYARLEQYDDAFAVLQKIDGSQLDEGQQVSACTNLLMKLHRMTALDTAPFILRFWEEIGQSGRLEQSAEKRKGAFLSTGAAAFAPSYREDEVAREGFKRYAYTVFLPLDGKCVLGNGATILERSDPIELEKRLAQEKLENLPISSLAHALRCGVAFPLPDHPMSVKEMDTLAVRLAPLGNLMELAAAVPQPEGDLQALCWRRSLLLAAIRDCKWDDEVRGMALAKAFEEMERQFLPACYTASVLTKEGMFLLPPMHRFGWYLIRAFEALDMGDAASYVRLLRSGLESNEGAKSMVEFLTKHTPELQAPPPSAEMIVLAEQIRTVLAGFAPDDPAVAALKQSEAYQKAAYLIEGLEPPVVGGQLQ